MIPAMHDTRGKESKTLTFVTAAYVPVLIKFTFAGLTVFGLEFPPMSATEFGAAIAAILAIWLGREWTEKRQ